jgi:mannose-6-phosphate isomerase-like protein (cupin superfamily)
MPPVRSSARVANVPGSAYPLFRLTIRENRIMTIPNRPRFRLATLAPSALAIALGLGWTAREVAFANERAALVRSATVTVDQVVMSDHLNGNKAVGKAGLYLQGDTPGSTKFVTGRFVLAPGQTPHPPHVHSEEEVMIIESGQGEIFCDGKTTKIGPGSVMYTTPNAPHGITNTGETPIVFYFVKWQGTVKN